jgi:N6-adenosine-specific RNA methylase IME4
MGGLVRYETACRALAEAVSVDEVLQIRDAARQLEACARVAKNRQAEADAVALRLRAVRRLGQLQQAQKETVGLNRGAAGGGKKAGPRGKLINPRDLRPTLASQGIDKSLAHQGRVLSGLSEQDFETVVDDACGKTNRAVRSAVREVEIEQEREERREHTALGDTVVDLHALAASGFRAGVIAVDPPWTFEVYSDKGKQRSAERHYGVMTLDQIKALPVAQLAAKDCALFLWCTWPTMPIWCEVIEAWGLHYSGLAFDWVKLNPNGNGLHTGLGLSGTRANPEPCLLATHGKPLRLDLGVHSVIMAPVGRHSEKPDEAYRRMEKLFGGPRLELFARKPRPNWRCWGDEIKREEIAL